MLKKLCTAMVLIAWFGCSTNEEKASASAQVVAPATAAPSTKKWNKPTMRQVMPEFKMKVAPAGLVKPANKVRLQYKPMLARPTKSAI